MRRASGLRTHAERTGWVPPKSEAPSTTFDRGTVFVAASRGVCADTVGKDGNVGDPR